MSTYVEIVNGKVLSMQGEIEELLKNQLYQECLALIRRALAIDPRNAKTYYLRGEVFLSLNDFTSAIISIAKALRIEPFSKTFQERLAVTHGRYGDSLVGENKFLQALVNYKLANGIQPCYMYMSKCIFCHIHLQDYDNALIMLDYSLNQEKSVELLVTRAKLHLLFGNATKCYDDVYTALKLEPSCQEALHLKYQLERRTATAEKKAFGYGLLQKQKEAIKQMDIAIDSDPYNAKHHILRGILHRQVDSFDKSVDDFLFAMDKCGHSYENPLYIEAGKELVLTFNDFAVECFKKECYTDAVSLLNKALKQEKNNFILYVNRGDCYFKLHEYAFALCDYQQASELADACYSGLCYRLAITHFNLAVRDFSMKKLISAEEHFSAAIVHCPFTSSFYVCRATVKSLLKKISQAQNDVVIALLLDPNYEECFSLLNKLFPGYTINNVLCSEQAQSVKLNFNLLSQSKLEHVIKRKDEIWNHPFFIVASCVCKSKQYCQLLNQYSSPTFCMEEDEFHVLIYYTKKEIAYIRC